MTNANYAKRIHNTQFCEPGVLIVTVIKISRPRQNVCHFADDGFKCIFMNGNIWISIKISLRFVPKGSVNTISALFQIMTWCRIGDNPPSEPMLTRFTDTYIRHWGEMSWMLMYKCTVKTKVWKVVIIPKQMDTNCLVLGYGIIIVIKEIIIVINIYDGTTSIMEFSFSKGQRISW